MQVTLLKGFILQGQKKHGKIKSVSVIETSIFLLQLLNTIGYKMYHPVFCLSF